MSATYLTYDDAQFRATIPFFANATTYPQALMQQFFTNGIAYISNYNAGILQGDRRQLALYLMTGHLAALNDLIIANDGSVPGLVTNAKVDKVQVQITPPPAKDQWEYWLNLTPWGQQLLALLQVASAGGFFIGGRPEGLGFRRVFGGFGTGRPTWLR